MSDSAPVSEPRLCYIKEPWAYFTLFPSEKVRGDDWNDAPYEHNAEPPYAEYVAFKVAYDAPLSTPAERAFSVCVDDINAGGYPWLFSAWSIPKISIPAWVTYSEFCRLIREAGGDIYIKESK